MNDPLDFSAFEQAAIARASNPGAHVIRFWDEPTPDDAESLKAGRPIYKHKHMAGVRNPGSRDEWITKVNDNFFQKYGRAAYDQWCKDQTQPEEGTPLELWPPIPKTLVEEWKFFHVRTVEQLAAVTDNNVQRMGMGVLEWRKKAQAWLDDAQKGAASQKLVSDNERLSREVARLEKQVQDLKSHLDGKPAAPAMDIAAIAALVAQQMKNGAST